MASERQVQHTATAVALETLWFEDVGGGRTRLRTQALVEVPARADAQTRLLGFIGRDPFWPGG